MGRGRAKAKQTKVARELKYSSPQTDFERLQRELSGAEGTDDDGERSRKNWRRRLGRKDDSRRQFLEPRVPADQLGHG